jgi:hypothetical protein
MSITKTRLTKTNKYSVAEKMHVQLDVTKHWALVAIRNKEMATTATIGHELGQSRGVYFDFYNLQESTLLLPAHTQSYFKVRSKINSRNRINWECLWAFCIERDSNRRLSGNLYLTSLKNGTTQKPIGPNLSSQFQCGFDHCDSIMTKVL